MITLVRGLGRQRAAKGDVSAFFNRIAVQMMGREPDTAVIQAIIEKAQPPIFDYLESEIGDKTYLCGDAFSIADIAITCQFIQMMYSGEELPANSHPGIARYVTHHMHRDSFKGLIANDPFMDLE